MNWYFTPTELRQPQYKTAFRVDALNLSAIAGVLNIGMIYLNTVAGTVLGRKEGGFPKIRNPNMTGVACKHILRVMHWIKVAARASIFGYGA